MNIENHSQTAALIWSISDLLRGDFKQSQYGRIILPFTLLRRMECVLEPTKVDVLAQAKMHQSKPDTVRELFLLKAACQKFYNASSLSLSGLSDTQTADDLMSYVQAFSADAREIFEHFHFEDFVQQLSASDLLYQVVNSFATVDLSPEKISNFGMGLIFEELIRKFAESSNETAGEHFTPRDIVLVGVKGKNKGKVEADSSLRDYENVPLGMSIYEYFDREVKPHVADAWIDEGKCDAIDGEVGIVGFEIPFNRHFYVFAPPRSLDEIDGDLKACTVGRASLKENRIKQMIEELSA